MGIEKIYRNIGFVQLPMGKVIPAEGYREFEAAFEVFQATEAFSASVAKSANEQAGPVVWLAGETDPIYFEGACKALGFNNLVGKNIFRWIGSTDEKGQGFFTGDDSLKKAFSMMRANPEIASQPTLFLFDCDAAQSDFDEGKIHVRTISLNTGNSKVRIGVENLLDENVFSDEFYEERVKDRLDGGSSSLKQLNKMKLCHSLCANPDPNVFEGFRSEIEKIAETLGIV